MSVFLILSILIGNLVFAKTGMNLDKPLHFISEADDIEKEAWWLITGKRLSNDQSPWRLVSKALLEFKNQKSKHINLNMCQKLRTQADPKGTLFTITSHCLAQPIDMATVRKWGASKWEFQFRVAPFSDHYGLGTSIFYQTMTCHIELDEKSKIQKMQCPVYARNRSVEEIVELKNFEFNKKGEPLMKIQGVVKKQFQDVAKIETFVPRVGEIVIKEMKLIDLRFEEPKLPSSPRVQKPEVKPPVQALPQEVEISPGEMIEGAEIAPADEVPAIEESASPIPPSR